MNLSNIHKVHEKLVNTGTYLLYSNTKDNQRLNLFINNGLLLPQIYLKNHIQTIKTFSDNHHLGKLHVKFPRALSISRG